MPREAHDRPPRRDKERVREPILGLAEIDEDRAPMFAETTRDL